MKKKITKKVNNAVYTIDATWCTTCEDLAYEIARAKFAAGIALDERDIYAILYKYQQAMFPGKKNCVIKDEDDKLHFLTAVPHKCEEKKPWYKRFWNWITRKN